jgi:hypothetical protein
MNDNTFLTQIVEIKNKLTNTELNLIRFFYNLTNISPVNIIIYQDYIFYFVSHEDYFKAKRLIPKLRFIVAKYKRKILIVRAEKTLLKLIFTFFQDTYIHDIRLKYDDSKKIVVLLEFLSEQDMIIAVGNKGSYIKAINAIIEAYLSYRVCSTISKKIPIEIRCEMTKLDFPLKRDEYTLLNT